MSERLEFQDIGITEKAPFVGQLVLGNSSRCNLDCGYCPIFNGGDDTWKKQPKIMPMSVVSATASRLAEELDRHDASSSSFEIVMQRGEPTLAPVSFFDEAIPLFRRAVGQRRLLKFGLQTNGTRLTDDFLQTARKHRLRIGISMDGDQYVNDMHRLTRAGISLYPEMIEGIERVVGDERYRPLFTGFLAVMPHVKDLSNIDPLQVYRHAMQYDPPALDFLLPHMHWESLQPGMRTQDERDLTPYANFLKPIFDEWIKGDITRVRIRTFDSILQILRGGATSVESIGESDPTRPILLAINGDGGYEMVDTLSMVPGQVHKAGLNVLSHSFEQASAAITRKAKQLGMLSLSPMCQGCPHRKECGGGYVTHRYSHGNLFDNPSTYCADLAALITHIKGAIVSITKGTDAGISYSFALEQRYRNHASRFTAPNSLVDAPKLTTL